MSADAPTDEARRAPVAPARRHRARWIVPAATGLLALLAAGWPVVAHTARLETGSWSWSLGAQVADCALEFDQGTWYGVGEEDGFAVMQSVRNASRVPIELLGAGPGATYRFGPPISLSAGLGGETESLPRTETVVVPPEGEVPVFISAERPGTWAGGTARLHRSLTLRARVLGVDRTFDVPLRQGVIVVAGSMQRPDAVVDDLRRICPEPATITVPRTAGA